MQLRGMTWDHPRGYDPLDACSRLWREKTGVEIVWDRRSLQDFESFPIETLARRYDLIVIDHPHVGEITAEACVAPLDVPDRQSECTALAEASVGPSWQSYHWNGRQWALPIDAATQVQAWRPDRIEAPAVSWSETLALARKGRVSLPLRAPHSLMTIFTLCANLGRPCASEGPELFERETGAVAVDMIRELVALIDAACFAMDPIAVLEDMARREGSIACAPLVYGYVSYSHAGFRPARLRFADIPQAGALGPIGSTLGGTGMAVSAFSSRREAAMDFAFWVASGPVQSGPSVAAGGQPAHSGAWRDPAANEAAADFYKATRATLDGAWLRPRHDAYMAFQSAASLRLNEGLRAGEKASASVEALNSLFRASQRADGVRR
jgi:multiple sugar transport system substrate-binding protein